MIPKWVQRLINSQEIARHLEESKKALTREQAVLERAIQRATARNLASEKWVRDHPRMSDTRGGISTL